MRTGRRWTVGASGMDAGNARVISRGSTRHRANKGSTKIHHGNSTSFPELPDRSDKPRITHALSAHCRSPTLVERDIPSRLAAGVLGGSYSSCDRCHIGKKLSAAAWTKRSCRDLLTWLPVGRVARIGKGTRCPPPPPQPDLRWVKTTRVSGTTSLASQATSLSSHETGEEPPKKPHLGRAALSITAAARSRRRRASPWRSMRRRSQLVCEPSAA